MVFFAHTAAVPVHDDGVSGKIIYDCLCHTAKHLCEVLDLTSWQWFLSIDGKADLSVMLQTRMICQKGLKRCGSILRLQIAGCMCEMHYRVWSATF